MNFPGDRGRLYNMAEGAHLGRYRYRVSPLDDVSDSQHLRSIQPQPASGDRGVDRQESATDE